MDEYAGRSGSALINPRQTAASRFETTRSSVAGAMWLVLESSNTLSPPVDPVTTSPAVVGGQNSVTVDAGQVYRLRKPNIYSLV